MNAEDFLRLGIPLGEATGRATDFVSQFILSGGDKSLLERELKAILASAARRTHQIPPVPRFQAGGAKRPYRDPAKHNEKNYSLMQQ